MATRQHKLPASARTICGQAGKKNAYNYNVEFRNELHNIRCVLIISNEGNSMGILIKEG